MVLALLALVMLASQQSNFMRASNLANLSDQWTPIAVMAFGMTICLIGGGFDLSVGATYALSATLCASLSQHHSAPYAIGVTVVIAGLVGLVNGVLITKLAINPLIATLGTSQIVGGAALLRSNGTTFSVRNHVILDLGSGRIGQLPVSALVLLGGLLVASVVLGVTAFGHDLYATGGNRVASYISGIRTDRVRTLTYVATGLTAGVAGILYVGRVGSGQANIGTGIELQVIAAALIGGVSLLGGEGKPWQALTGVAILAVLQNYFNQASVNAYWQSIVQGTVIVAAVGIDAFGRGESLVTLRAWLVGVRSNRGRTHKEAAPTVSSNRSVAVEPEVVH
jgi:ribose/xylose/arabinose/galactoside ABC-type transport system permease subunit